MDTPVSELENWIKTLEERQKNCSRSFLKKLWFNPWQYLPGLIIHKFISRIWNISWNVSAQTFYGKEVRLIFPGSFDIYIYGIKSHDSEVRLAKLLLRYLCPGQNFLDVGTHIGYFSLLAAVLIGKTGRVAAVEPAQNTFRLLLHNTESIPQIQAYNVALGDRDEKATFIEYLGKYSEDNQLKISSPPKERAHQVYPVQKMTLSSFLENNSFTPDWIKIDVEGGEADVIKGGLSYLRQHQPYIIMEVLKNYGQVYFRAVEMLDSIGYACYRIDQYGNPVPVNTFDAYYANLKDSDNLFFSPPDKILT